MQTVSANLGDDIMGTCDIFEERTIGKDRYTLFNGCKQQKAATIILRGGGDAFIDEMERSINDALMVVRRARKHTAVVAGGGAIEIEVSKYLREYSRTIHGKQQLIINAFAKALEVIPHQISENAGLDATTILNKLRQKHDQGGKWYGVDILNDNICDTYESFVWEPALVKLNALTAATEAACLILSVDETIKNAAADHSMPGGGMPGGGMGRGGMPAGMGRGGGMPPGGGGGMPGGMGVPQRIPGAPKVGGQRGMRVKAL